MIQQQLQVWNLSYKNREWKFRRVIPVLGFTKLGDDHPFVLVSLFSGAVEQLALTDCFDIQKWVS